MSKRNESTDRLLASIGGLVTSVAGLALTVVVGSWVFVVLWGWFVVPLGVPPVGKAHAYGLMILVGMMKFGLSKEKQPEGSSWTRFITVTWTSVVMYLTMLSLGWIAHSLM